jgi:hypothetical protein
MQVELNLYASVLISKNNVRRIFLGFLSFPNLNQSNTVAR